MKIKNRSIVELSDNRKYLVDDIKVLDNKEVALLQDLETGDFVFALENNDALVMVIDKKLEAALAKEFDKVDGNLFFDKLIVAN